MADEQKTSSSTAANNDAKKPYAKPKIASEPIYETMALACSKANVGGQCPGNTHKLS